MNKNFLLLAVAITASFISQSQIINKGDKLFGGSFAFIAANAHLPGEFDNTSGNLGFRPQISLGIGKNLTAGIIGSFRYEKTKSGLATNKSTTTAINAGAGLFLKKYKELKSRFGIYFMNAIDIGKGYVKIDHVLPEYDQKNSYWFTGYYFTPGVFYKFSDRFLGEANVGGASVNYEKSKTNGRTIRASVDLFSAFNIGVNYIIPRKG